MRRGLFVLGLVTFLVGLGTAVFIIGIPLIILGLYWVVKGLTSNRPVVDMRTAPQMAMQSSPPPQVIVREREVTREVVKVPCRYCGSLNDITTTKFCPSCGAPVK